MLSSHCFGRRRDDEKALYARFYEAGTELLVEHGQLDSSRNPTAIIQTVKLGDNVEAVNSSKNGTGIQMVLRFDDGSE